MSYRRGLIPLAPPCSADGVGWVEILIVVYLRPAKLLFPAAISDDWRGLPISREAQATRRGRCYVVAIHISKAPVPSLRSHFTNSKILFYFMFLLLRTFVLRTILKNMKESGAHFVYTY